MSVCWAHGPSCDYRGSDPLHEFEQLDIEARNRRTFGDCLFRTPAGTRCNDAAVTFLTVDLGGWEREKRLLIDPRIRTQRIGVCNIHSFILNSVMDPMPFLSLG